MLCLLVEHKVSRIAKIPVSIPKGVTVGLNNSVLTVKGSLGQLEQQIHPAVVLNVTDEEISFVEEKSHSDSKVMIGTMRSLVNNMVTGVSAGFEKRLQITGVGYRAQLDGKDLVLNMGYSHPVKMITPETLLVKVENPTTVLISGIEKDLVGEFAAKIRSVRPPEPYKGKGIAYEGEVIRRKAGKTGK